VTLPDLSPEDRPVATRATTRRERLVEGALLALVLVLAAGLSLPELADIVRERSVDLGAVFYPVVLIAFAGLAWSRRSGR